ncbi:MULTISPECIES: BlaI/MecI/CopY family transcriptional regulator [unclassified Schlesneria]|uniref:BlaI/MecI/CopY family transcriptional regulator n=1 Tax=Schlesneria TaxID=656899 RepID=UPI002F201E08
MAKKKQTAKLSVGELRLMAVLWRLGPLKLSEAYREQPGNVGYTTIQTQLNRLVDKGVAVRSKSRPMRYEALLDPNAAGAGMLQLLVDTVGSGSILPLVQQLVTLRPISKSEALELKEIIDDSVSPRKGVKKAVKRVKAK